MKQTLIALAICAVSITVQAQDFGGCNWGDSKEDVLRKSEMDLLDDNSYIFLTAVQEQFVGYSTMAVYGFNFDGELHQGLYFLDEQTSDNKNIYAYESWKDSLTEKYGKPKSDDIVWYDDIYKSDREDWGMADGLGDLTMEAVWEVNGTKIELTMSGAKCAITLRLAYLSPSFLDVAANKKSKF